MHELTDSGLIPHLIKGNEEAFRVLFERYHRQLYYMAKKYVKSPELAEDAVQDIFLKLWEKRFSLDASKSVKGFLFTIMRNHLLNMIRGRHLEILSAYDVQIENLQQKNIIEDEIAYKEYEKIFEAGLDELTGRTREVFELKTMDGHTNSEIADMLNINIRTVKTHYYTSSRFIKKYLRNHAGISGLWLLIMLSSLFIQGISA
jgi:RNA polymerase sigma-70 factor (family 1)